MHLNSSGGLLLLRITSAPRVGELDEFDERELRLGNVYDISGRLGSALIIGGYAEPMSPTTRLLNRDGTRDRPPVKT
jgi:hypothetical protein